MSWQQYVDNNLVGTGQVVAGAILGHDGSIWANTPGFNISAVEAKAIIAGFSSADALRANGQFISNEKYLVLKADDRSIYAKKGTGGSVSVKTGQSVLVGTYNEKIQPGQCANVVEKLADYLIEQGY